MTKRNERTTARVAKIAAKYMAMKAHKSVLFEGCVHLPNGDIVLKELWRDICAMAASCLTQTADKPKRKIGRKV